MVKSLLLTDGTGHYVMACVLGNARLDVHAVAACLPPEWKRLHFAAPAEIAAVTGYPQGAVNPIGLPGDVPVIMDVAVAACVRVNISRGDPLAGTPTTCSASPPRASPRSQPSPLPQVAPSVGAFLVPTLQGLRPAARHAAAHGCISREGHSVMLHPGGSRAKHPLLWCTAGTLRAASGTGSG
jgi:hypothetical protein